MSKPIVTPQMLDAAIKAIQDFPEDENGDFDEREVLTQAYLAMECTRLRQEEAARQERMRARHMVGGQ